MSDEQQKVSALNTLRAQINAKILAEKTFQLKKAEERMNGTGFTVGGINQTSVIKNLTQINGIPIAELERRMRDFSGETGQQEEEIIAALEHINDHPPTNFGKATIDNYEAIFLGPNESLIGLLAEDNDSVLGLNLTHQQLAGFLNNFTAIHQRSADSPEYIHGKNQGVPFGTFTFSDRQYEVEIAGSPNAVGSPFDDGLAGARDFFVTCLNDRSQFQFGSMQPDLIHRWGFYEGKGTAYRLDPRKLAEFAGFIPK